MTYLFNANTNANVVQSVKLTANIQNNNSVVSVSNPLPVTLGSENVTITGNVNFVDTVNVASSPENPVHIHITEVANSGNLVANGYTYLPIGGNVSIYNSNGSAITNTNPISIQIIKNGLAVSDTVGLPTRVINDEALISYARGKPVTEADVLNAYLIDKSGATENLGTTAATMSTVWSGTGLYPWATFTGAGAKLYIKSLTNDPKVQGKSVTIEGLDSNYDILLETVTLHPTDTTTAVSTTNNFYRINRIYLSGANTNNLPHDYDIEVRYGSSSGTLVSKFTAPWGRGQNCFYTVPRGYEAFVLSINGNSGKMDEITSSLWFHPYGGTWTLQKSFKFISGTFDHNFRTPLRITEKSDIEIRAFALVESSRIGTEFQLLILPKA